MKKFIVISSVLFLILAFGVAAYAQAPKLEFKASGFIDAQSFWYVNAVNAGAASVVTGAGGNIYNNITPNYRAFDALGNPAKALDRTVGFMESRARLKFDAIMGKELSGTLFFEFDSAPWGNTRGGVANKISDRNAFGFWSGDRSALEVKNIYIDFGLPYIGIPAPMTFRIGLQPLSIRPNLLVYTDGMGVIGSIKMDPVNVQALWFRPYEGSDWAADDVDVWGLHINAKLSTFTIGAYGLYYNMNTYPFNVSTNPNVGGVAVTNIGAADIKALKQQICGGWALMLMAKRVL